MQRFVVPIVIVMYVCMYVGDDDVQQLGKIFNVLGTPTRAEWPDVELLPNYVEFEACEAMSLAPLVAPSNTSFISGLKCMCVCLCSFFNFKLSICTVCVRVR